VMGGNDVGGLDVRLQLWLIKGGQLYKRGCCVQTIGLNNFELDGV